MNRRLHSRDWWIASGIFIFISLIYIRTVFFDFINMDDSYYVQGHDIVTRGLTYDGVQYAFTSFSEGNYLPLTWLSHMAVVEIGGTGPAAHHAANVLLHAATASLFFLFLRTATAAAGLAVMTALFWAIHPLRVESVAWVAERKDVLSGLLFVLALIVYRWYTQRPGVVRYLVVVVLACAGILAKSIVVVLPCVLLLLDHWPLNRTRFDEPGRWLRVGALAVEKIPLFALSIAAGLVAIWSQRDIGALNTFENVPVPHRFWNALASCATYLFQTAWPFGLGVYYPYRDNQSLYLWGAAGILACGAIAIAAAGFWKTKPFIATGWLWFLVTLAPVIGIVQVGAQAHADRYTYLPHMGLFMAAVWVCAELGVRRRWPIKWQAATSMVLVLVLATATWRQTGFWRDSETLFRHTLAVTGPNRFAEGNYGDALLNLGRTEEAEKHFRNAITIGPALYSDYHNLGAALMMLNRFTEAREALDMALRMNPGNRMTWVIQGDVNLQLLDARRATEAYREAARLGENSAKFHTNYGIALGMAGRSAEAAAEFRLALALTPDYVPALFNAGVLSAEEGDAAQAQAYFERVIAIDPNHAEAHSALSDLQQGNR